MEQPPDNLTWHAGQVTPADRRRILGQRGATLWFLGLSGSGKSTVAVAVEQALTARGHLAYRLDGDNVRHGLCRDLGFSDADREENNRRVGEVAKLLTDAGLFTLCSFISPLRRTRDAIRELHEEADLPFLEIFVDVPLEVAESRDPKGLYQKARAGEIPHFTGLTSPFEPPDKPELTLRTHEQSIEASVEAVLSLLADRDLLTTDGRGAKRSAATSRGAP